MSEEQASTTTQPTDVPPTATVPSQRDLRVSDGEREHVVGVLQKAIGRGMLDLDEFSERTDIALAARTRGELNAVLTDLPGLAHRDAPFTPMSPAADGEPYPYQPSGERMVLTAHGSGVSRGGGWVVPGELLVRNKYGSVKLDFTEARVTQPVVQLELRLKWGSAELILPEHAAVDINGLTDVRWSSVEDKTHSNGRAGNPRFVITGSMRGGSLTIRNPRRMRWLGH